jgi:hypothetical protein
VAASLKFVLRLMAFAVALAFGAGYVELRQAEGQARTVAEGITGGDSVAGKEAIQRYGCGGYHTIAGSQTRAARPAPRSPRSPSAPNSPGISPTRPAT